MYVYGTLTAWRLLGQQFFSQLARVQAQATEAHWVGRVKNCFHLFNQSKPKVSDFWSFFPDEWSSVVPGKCVD